CALPIFTRPTLRDCFHPPDPPIALQSITRDVRFTHSHPPNPARLFSPTRPTDCVAIDYPRRAHYPSSPAHPPFGFVVDELDTDPVVERNVRPLRWVAMETVR